LATYQVPLYMATYRYLSRGAAQTQTTSPRCDKPYESPPRAQL
jgi:hypothetical protein